LEGYELVLSFRGPRVEPFLVRAGLIDHVTAAARPLAGDGFVTLWPREGASFER
jgi:hypothetical protein